MSNEKFKVKFGLAVGDTSMTVDAATGNTETNGIGVFKQNTTGSVTLGDGSNNGSIEIGQLNRATSGTPYIDFHSSATNADYDVRLLVSGGNSTAGQGSLTVEAVNLYAKGDLDVQGGDITVSTANPLTLSTTNNSVIVSPGGTGTFQVNSAMSATGRGTFSSGSTGEVLIGNDGSNNGSLEIGQQNRAIAGTPFIDFHSSATNTDYDVRLLASGGTSSSGAGQLTIEAATVDINGNLVTDGITGGAVTVGVDTDQTISTTSGNLILQTAAGVNAGTITLASGTNGNITLAPNGTGSVVNTFSNGGNLTSNRSAITGAIRSGTGATAGNYTWALNGALATQPFRGFSVDNSADTAVNAGYVARNYSNTAGNRSRIIFERARGTAASPTAVQSGDFIGSIEATGCNAAGVFINDALQTGATTTTIPGFMSFTAAETWSAGTGTGPIYGTSFGVSLAPTATAITSGAILVPVISANPQTFASRSDAFTWANGKTGTTQTMALDVSGNLTVTGDLRINGNDIKGSGGNNAITLTSANTVTTVVGDMFNVNNAAGTNFLMLNNASGKITLSVNQFRATSSTEHATTNFNTYRSADGVNYTPTQNGDVIGQFKFNGNANTSTSPGVPAGPGAQITATATELWSPTQNGTKFNFTVIKKGATTDVVVISAASDTTTFKSDSFTFEDSTGTDYAVFNSTSATFLQPVGFPVKTAAQWNAITGSVGQQVCVSDSPVVAGKMAYWSSTATAGWRYIDTNTAI